jgi:hypothetical protein
VSEFEFDDADDVLAFLAAQLTNDPSELDHVRGVLGRSDIDTRIKTMLITGLATRASTSVGSCGICGASLQYKGYKTEGLRVCCTGKPRHCWSMDGAYIP